jgi:protein-S-isoprenylcysteine O-methyltransferase Ste14
MATTNQTMDEPGDAATKVGVRRALIKIGLFTVFFAALLFGSAGTLEWPMAWAYLAVICIGTAVAMMHVSPDLIAERSKIQAGTKSWDKVLASLVALVGPIATVVTAGLDHRFGWSPELSAGQIAAGIALTILGYLVMTWSMWTNRFFSSTVRIQHDRGHEVVTGGPYRFVRHPGYFGVLLYNLGTPLFLESYWTLIPGLFVIMLTVVRTALEDRTLNAELAGYRQYAETVRNRLIPGVW